MEQEKRGLCRYENKRYLFAYMPDGNPNSITYAYGHRDLVTEVNLVAESPEPGADTGIRPVEERFKSRHAGVIRRLQNDNTINEEEPED